MPVPQITAPLNVKHLAEGKGRWLDLPDGGRVRVRLEPDMDEDTPWMRTGEGRQRPADFNGAAVKVTTRGGPRWYQPPTDLPADLQAQDIARARDFFLERWDYTGIVVTRESPEVQGPFGNPVRDTVEASLWGLASDETDYHAEVVGDLLAEVGIVAFWPHGEGL